MSIVTSFIQKIWVLITSRSRIIFYSKRLAGSCWTKNRTISNFLLIRFKWIVVNLVSLIKYSIMSFRYSRRLSFRNFLRRKSTNTWIESWFFNSDFFQTFYILPYFLCSYCYILLSNIIKRFLNILLVYDKGLSFCAWFKNATIFWWLFILIEA